MAKFVCDACGWEYDEELGSPENGIAPGTKFADLPEDFECPLCGVGKDMFSEDKRRSRLGRCPVCGRAPLPQD